MRIEDEIPVSVEAGGLANFERDICVRGYHEYKAIWAAVGEESENQLTSLDILMSLLLHLLNCTALLAASIALMVSKQTMVHQDWRDPYQVQLFEKSHGQQFSYSSL